MTRIFFGGSFDPVHRGHLAMADAAKKWVKPREFYWIPTWISPHKLEVPPAAVEDRLALLQCALQSRIGEEVLDLEIQRKGPSYTVDTLRTLQENAPNPKDYFILGGDSLERLADWKDIGEIMRRVTFLIAPRGDWGPEMEAGWRASLPEDLNTLFQGQWLPMAPVAVSSHNLRAQLRQGEDVVLDFPEGVLDEIRSRRLYQS